ncbi:MAG: hypothetical protein WCC81_24730, partial [Pseudolabrys sp.]
MRLEYFQLIDRIVDLRLADRKIDTEATVPTTSTVFEGHFPGFPLMPGVLPTSQGSAINASRPNSGSAAISLKIGACPQLSD